MYPRAASLIQMLGLRPHPEGGYYREVFRSPRMVRVEGGGARRSALTVIDFLLLAGQVSRWHRVASDEVWHHCEGDPLELHTLDGTLDLWEPRTLGPASPTSQPVLVVPGGAWQAARTLGAYTLVGCTVGPGFDFEDFSLMADFPREAERLRERYPELVRFL